MVEICEKVFCKSFYIDHDILDVSVSRCLPVLGRDLNVEMGLKLACQLLEGCLAFILELYDTAVAFKESMHLQ